MKMKNILALLLVLAMMLTFFGCAQWEDGDRKNDKEGSSQIGDKKDDDDKNRNEDTGIVGEWQGTLDLSIACNLLFEEMLGEDLAKYLEIDRFDVRTTITFEENGQYDITLNEKDVEDALEDASDIWVDGYYEIIELVIEEADLNMTADEYAEEMLGCSVEEFITNAFADSLDVSSMETSGNYELNGKKLYLDEDDSYYTIALDGDQLEFKEYINDKSDIGSYLGTALFKNVIFERQ